MKKIAGLYDARLYVRPITDSIPEADLDRACAAAIAALEQADLPLAAFMDLAGSLWWSGERREAWENAQRAADACMPAGEWCQLYVA